MLGDMFVCLERKTVSTRVMTPSYRMVTKKSQLIKPIYNWMLYIVSVLGTEYHGRGEKWQDLPTEWEQMPRSQ